MFIFSWDTQVLGRGGKGHLVHTVCSFTVFRNYEYREGSNIGRENVWVRS